MLRDLVMQVTSTRQDILSWINLKPVKEVRESRNTFLVENISFHRSTEYFPRTRWSSPCQGEVRLDFFTYFHEENT